MSIWTELLIGSGIGLVVGHAAVAIIHRSVWGHWRFWERKGQ
jgi:hypothetical protein